MKKILSLLLIVLLILSCSKKDDKNYTKKVVNGVEIIQNKNRPADPNFKVNLKELYRVNIDSLEDVDYIKYANADFDSKGNMYLIDFFNSKIYKFGERGEYKFSFGGKGRGPGEFVNKFEIKVSKDTVFIPDFKERKVIKFDENGKFICDKKFEDRKIMPQKLISFGKNYISENAFLDVNHVYCGINLYDENLNFIKTYLDEEKNIDYKKGYNPNDYSFIGLIAANKDNYFRALSSDKKYQIDMFDINGSKIRSIQKNFVQIPLTKEQKEIELERGRKSYQKFLIDHKIAIEKIYMDKYGKLWVESNNLKNENSNKKSYDIFEDGIFINRVTLDINKDSFFAFRNDRIFTFNSDRQLIKAFDY